VQKSNLKKLRPVEHKSVSFWLNRMTPNNRQRSWNILANFIDWLGENSPQFADYDPDMLVVYQREARNGERFEILDELQRYVQGMKDEWGQDLRYGSKQRYFSAIKGFFAHNRVELPDDARFVIMSDTPMIEGYLPLTELRDIILSCNECYRAIFTSMFQGALDQEGFIFWNENGWEKLLEDLKADQDIIRINLPGRKKKKNRKKFYTYIGGDAISAIRNWLVIRPVMIPVLDAEGEPKLDEANEMIMRKNPYIFTNQSRKPIKKPGLYMLWRRTLVRLGFVERTNGPKVYSGKGPHEMRDTFRSMWEKSPAKGSVAEFQMGHKIDALEYNKAYRDMDWTRKEYTKALPFLQIMSSGRPFGLIEADSVEDMQIILDATQKRMAKIEKTNALLLVLLGKQNEDLIPELQRVLDT